MLIAAMMHDNNQDTWSRDESFKRVNEGIKSETYHFCRLEDGSDAVGGGGGPLLASSSI